MTQRVMTSMRDDYVLGHSSDEYERLRRQAKVLEPATRRVFQLIGLQPGWTCLDVGCGPGESMRLMGEFVGPSGDVTGLDRDRKAGCEAIERLRAAGPSRYHFVEADIETVDQIGGRLFDLTFARLAQNKRTHPLFDTDRFRLHIEAAYRTMWERSCRGEVPASFRVDPVRAG